MLKLKSKPKATEPIEADFETARARHAKAKAEYHAKRDAAENATLAIQWSQVTTDRERESDRMTWLRERIKAAYPNGLPKLRKLVRQAEDAEDDLRAATPKWFVEVEVYRAAARRETTRIATALQTRQRATVQKIATALETLSVAISEEQALHAELRSAAPESESASLPDASHELIFANLADFNSSASAWARRIRKLGILG